MSTPDWDRRAAIAACGAFSLVAAMSGKTALAQSGLPVDNIRVDAPLRANTGDPTATWVEQELPRQLAEALMLSQARQSLFGPRVRESTRTTSGLLAGPTAAVA
jgi:hypothetical protein